MDSLNEQLDTIKNTFQEIKDAIVEKGVEVDDCDSPTVYPTKIREIPKLIFSIYLTLP